MPEDDQYGRNMYSTIYNDEINRICCVRWQHVCQFFILIFGLSACRLIFAEVARICTKGSSRLAYPTQAVQFQWVYVGMFHVRRLIPIYIFQSPLYDYLSDVIGVAQRLHYPNDQSLHT